MLGGVLACALACSDGAATEGATGTGDDGGGANRGEPVFITPEEFRLQTTRTSDLELEVRLIYPGVTQLLVDDASVGLMDDLGGIGEFVPDPEHDGSGTLKLHFDGAMMPGEHRLQLFTPADPEPRRSQQIHVRLKPSGPPVLLPVLEPAVVRRADRLVLDGDLLLLITTPDGEPTRLTPVQPPWSDADTAPTLALSGYVPGGDVPAVSATRLDGATGDAHRLRVAWRVGAGGERIEVADLDLADGSATEPASALDLTPELTGTVEHAAYGRPLVRGDIVAAELLAAHDSESSLPGDRVLVSVAASGSPPSFGLPRRVQPGGTATDVDGLGPALDLPALRVEDGQPFSLRLAAHRAALVDVGDVLSLRVDAVEGEVAELPGRGPVTTLVAAFGSHTVMTRHGDGIEVLQLDTSGGNGSRSIAPPGGALPDAMPTGEPAVGVVAGSGVFLLPYGPTTPVHAVTIGDDKAGAQPLELFCDAVALAPGRSANEDGGTIDLACLTAGQLRLGTLASGV